METGNEATGHDRLETGNEATGQDRLDYHSCTVTAYSCAVSHKCVEQMLGGAD